MKQPKKKVKPIKVQGEGDCPAGYFKNADGKCVPLVTPPPPDRSSNEF